MHSPLNRSLVLLLLGALIFVAFLNLLQPYPPARGQNSNFCNPLPAHRCLIISLNAFYESNHTAVLSIFSDANVLARGGAQLGSAWLDVTDEPENQYLITHDYNSTGEYLDQNRTWARWTWNNASVFHSLGSTDFYPYDSWLFSITLSSPFLYGNGLNSTNTYFDFRSYLTDWNYVCPNGCFVYSYQTITTTFVLTRNPAGLLVPAAYVPWILWFLLGITVLIPPDDLANKTTVCVSIIFFLGGLLFARVLSFQSTGSSYVENTLYLILLLTSIYVLEAIFERIMSGREQSTTRSVARIGVELFLIVATIQILEMQYTHFSTLLKTYWWVTFPVIPTLYIPAVVVAWATVVNVCMIAIAIVKRIQRKRTLKQTEFAVNTGVF